MPTPEPVNPILSLLLNSPAFAQLSAQSCELLLEITSKRTLESGEILAREGDPAESLFFVLSGALQTTQYSPNQSDPLNLGSASPGELIGELSIFNGQPRTTTLQATEPTVVCVLPNAQFDRLCASFPTEFAPTVAWMASRLDAHQIAAAIAGSPALRALSPQARDRLSGALVRVHLTAGQSLFLQGEPGNAIYLILSGRIKLVRESASPAQVLAELGKGELLGELAVLTGEPRASTAIAVRDSTLARLEKPAFEALVAAFPTEFLGLFSRQLANRLRSQYAGHSREGRPPVAIAVLPLTPNEQTGGARDFAEELVRQLSCFGPTLHLSRTVIDRIFPENRGIGSKPGEPLYLTDFVDRRLLAWLEDIELLYRHVVYEADYQTGIVESAWTGRCLRQADVLLVVAGGPADPKKSEQTMVRLTQKSLPSVQTTLVLTHPGGPGTVQFTRVWKESMGIGAHAHIRRDSAGKLRSADVARIARSLNRQSVGLALGGGFALGLAHIGVIDAMRELDIPIDYVGGTSMGAILAAACAQEFTHDQMLEVMDQGCAQALKGDYTLPLLSLLTGRKVTQALGKYLETLEIEDLWLPYFAISASLVHARMVVHTSGSALKSVLASCRAPGMFPPLGWDGDVLVDGGLVNNIPADIMRQKVGAGTVFASDVSPKTEFTLGQEFSTRVSGWQVAARNFNPFSNKRKMGTLADVLMRLIRLGGVAHSNQIEASADLYLTLPLDQFTIRDFHRGEEMSKISHRHAKEKLEKWIAEHGRPWLGNAG
jgi:CRP-like cAMP-binding protein/predicted acylesterase/phospholipase RssA